jgi:hypothetical protein
VVAGGGKIDLLEGDPMPERIFIIEFPTADAARRWYQSDDYQEALKTRLSASSGRVFLIEGNGNNWCRSRGRFGRWEKLNPFASDIWAALAPIGRPAQAWSWGSLSGNPPSALHWVTRIAC